MRESAVSDTHQSSTAFIGDRPRPAAEHGSDLVRQTRLAALAQIAAGIAHDLRNPLGAILNAAYLLKRRVTKLEPQAAEYIEIIEEEVRHSDAIIASLMELTSGRDTRCETFDLGELIDEVHKSCFPHALVQVEKRLAPDPFQLHADRAQMRQVLNNLMTNAGQAMNGRGRIIIASERAAQKDIVRVEDSGAGVAADVQPHLFEPLFTTRPRALGLGLANCRKIVERHGGTIDYVSEPGRGAVFQVELPRVDL